MDIYRTGDFWTEAEKQEIQADMVKWRRALHQIPELGNELPKTSAYVQGVLSELGIEFYTLVGGSSIVARIDGTASGADGSGRVIALRADMDALAVAEETGLSFASKNGNMHACGHDGHTAMLLGAAKWLMRHRDMFFGSIKLFFQSGEEHPGGANIMIEEGCLENPKVEAVFGMHGGSLSNEVPTGSVGFRVGPLMAAQDTFVIDVIGKGGHGAYPQNAVDPIVIAAQIVSAFQTIVSRNVSPTDTAAVSITKINGGSSANIIPDKVGLMGTVRTFRHETRLLIAERIKALAEGIAAMHGGRAVVNHYFLYPALVNDEGMVGLAKKAASAILGEEKLIDIKEPGLAAEDFAFYAEKVPSCFVFMGSHRPIDGACHAHHSSKFDIDEDSFTAGAMLHCRVALDFLARSLK